MSAEKRKKPASKKKKRKFKLTSLPDSPVELAAMLTKLKDKEARLEADLAIKENPKVEIGITEVVLALSDVKRARQLQQVTRSATSNSRRAEATLSQIAAAEGKLQELRLAKTLAESVKTDRQIAFYENRLAILKESIADSPEVEDLAEIENGVRQAVNQLRESYLKWEPAFDSHGVDLVTLIPALAELVA